jgi:tRNA(fMet)-specific endonuclease VapC
MSCLMIIDTNIYSALTKQDPRIVSALQECDTLHIPVVVLAELRYGFAKGTRQNENNIALDRFLANGTVEILDCTAATTIHYAEIAQFCSKRGRALSHNDIWIAALALEYKIPLLSYDKDFEHIREILGDLLIALTRG